MSCRPTAFAICRIMGPSGSDMNKYINFYLYEQVAEYHCELVVECPCELVDKYPHEPYKNIHKPRLSKIQFIFLSKDGNDNI